MVNKHKLAIVFAAWMGIMHALWAILVLVGAADWYLRWIFGLHFLDISFGVRDFSVGSAVLLVLVAAIAGYVGGWILGAVWNWASKRR